MEDILNNNDVRKGTLESDNSDYFSKWGSRNPELTIREEIDNQIAANPTFAGIRVINKPNGRCNIESFNDGNTPTPERMEKMKCIGKTISDRNGASICGVGQIEGLVAGRKSPQSTGLLSFKSVHNGVVSRFRCMANGKDYTINTENSGPFPIDEPNIVEKSYEGMRDFDEADIEAIKVLVAVKIHPYAKEHPEFTYTVNGEEIIPFSVLYDGIKSESIKRMEIKGFVINYHGKEYIVYVGAVDIARYVKPDGSRLNKERADKLDMLYKMSPKSGGVFVELGGVNVITGGKESWRFIGRSYHTTHNGQRIWISIPSDGELKDAIFAESPNKSSVSICLNEITDYDGRHVFAEMLDEINKTLNSWTDERDSIDTAGRAVKKEKEGQIIKEVLENSVFVYKMEEALNELSDEEKTILGTKKFKTLMEFINNKEEKLCFSSAE